MGKCKSHSDFGIFKHNQAYTRIIQAHSGIIRSLCNPGILKTLANSELEAYSTPQYIQNAGIFQIRGLFRTLSNIYDQRFKKIVNDYNYFHKL